MNTICIVEVTLQLDAAGVVYMPRCCLEEAPSTCVGGEGGGGSKVLLVMVRFGELVISFNCVFSFFLLFSLFLGFDETPRDQAAQFAVRLHIPAPSRTWIR